MPINTNVTKDQITVSVGETQIDVNVSGGVGPTGNSGTIAVSAPITNAGTSTAAVIGLSTGTGLAVSAGSLTVSYGTTAGTACQGNDARLSDAREWSAATVSQADAEAGTSTDRKAFTPLRVFQAIAAWWAGSAAKTKLDGIASGATANQTDAYLLSRANHTGTQTAATISDFTSAVVAAAPPTTNASLLTSGTLNADRLPDSGVAAGSYSYVTVDAKGRVTAGADDPKWAVFLPSAPASVTGNSGDHSVSLSWAAPSPAPAAPITDYTIQYSQDNGTTWTTFADIVSPSTSVTVTGLANNTAYKFRIRAINAIGLGGFSAASDPVTPLMPRPTSVAGTAGDGQVSLTWAAPSPTPIDGIYDYIVQYSYDNGATWTAFSDGTSTATSAVVTGLVNGTGYKFRVAVVGETETSQYSNASTTVTPSASVPPSISGLTLWLDASDGSQVVSDSGAVVAWQDKSSSANNATVNSGGPAWQANVRNGLGALQFASGSNPLATTALPFAGSSGRTLFVVYQNTKNGGVSPVCGVSDNSVPGSWFQVQSRNLYGAVGDPYLAGYAADLGGGRNQTTAWQLCAASYDGAVASLRAGGLLIDSAPLSLNTAGTFRIGGDVDAGAGNANLFQGNIAEVIVYGRALTQSETELVEQYLAQKWGFEILSFIESLADQSIDAGQITFSAGYAQGKQGWTPGGIYGNVWLRDFAMMVRGRPSKFSATDIYNAVDLFCHLQGQGGEVYDAATPSGGAFLAASVYDAYDNVFELIDLVYSHFVKTGSTSAYAEFLGNITQALSWVSVQNHLVYIQPSPAPLVIGFGFQDTAASRGHEAMTSVMRYRAYSQLSEMALAAGDPDIYAAELPLIRAALIEYLWDASAGLLRNADIVNTQHSVPASAYAVVVGAVQGSVEQAICQTFLNALPGNSGDLAGKGFYQDGQVRHMPNNEFWTSVWMEYPAGTYQNGAYWSTFTGWAAEALERGQAGAGYALVNAVIAKHQSDSPSIRPVEASNSAVGYVGSSQYTASAALPLCFLRRDSR